MSRKSNAILETKELTKSFGSLVAVNEIFFTLYEGEIRAIIGPNGAGKTTFFSLLMGRLFPDKGKIFFKGEDITKLSVVERSHKGISTSFQITNIFPRRSTFENVRIAVQSRNKFHNPFIPIERLDGVNRKTIEILKFMGLDQEEGALAFNLSHGDQRKLEVAIALATEPSLLLLDEPTAGMSLKETTATIELIRKIKETKDLTIIIIEHDMKVIMEIADIISVFHYGKLIAEGSPDEIKRNEEVQEVYLKGGV